MVGSSPRACILVVVQEAGRTVDTFPGSGDGQLHIALEVLGHDDGRFE